MHGTDRRMIPPQMREESCSGRFAILFHEASCIYYEYFIARVTSIVSVKER
jgi:hypothetical protein